MRGLRLQLQLLCSTFHLTKHVKCKSWLVLTFALVFVILLRWKFLCINKENQLHIQNVCASYSVGQTVGNLCGDLCQPNGISTLACYNFYQEKQTVFSGIWGNSSVVFKSAKKTSDTQLIYWLDASKRKIYPSEPDFLNMVKTVVKLKFNIALNDIDAKRMTNIIYTSKSTERHMEMEHIWNLLQDNEYLASALYEKFELFPKLMGSCGSLYVVKKVNSISGFWHLMTLYDSNEEWLKRIKISIMILDYLMHLETKTPEPLLICNVKMNHFGVTNDFKKIVYLDLDSVHPVSVVSRITGDGSRCKHHSDCDYLNCRSFCNLISLRCEHGVVNNNLQIVCEHIFLGWVMSGRVMVPGLLIGPRTPRVLVEVLELCANPASERSTPRAPATRRIRKSLYDLLVHLTY